MMRGAIQPKPKPQGPVLPVSTWLVGAAHIDHQQGSTKKGLHTCRGGFSKNERCHGTTYST
eukprot:scaffold308093_cov27-Prasinocladus_malaysianus.AAC.1